MTHIYSSSALKTRQREIKDIAREDVVHITENGNGAFVFMSEDVYERQLREVAEQAAYEQRLVEAVKEGRRDIEEGRFVEGTDNFLAAMKGRVTDNG